MQEGFLTRTGGGWGQLVFEVEGLKYVTLENAEKQIPAGTYKVVLTKSGRAQRGTLWTCWANDELPELLFVPGRTAIRMHAANWAKQLEGCIAPGLDRQDDMLLHSRAALEQISQKIHLPFWLHVKES